jgi:hypothetical protein
MARPLYAHYPLATDLDATVYAFDATTIDLCLSVYPWAPFRAHKAAIKLHALLDLLDRGYLDFQRLFVIHQANAFFVTRAKSNTKFMRRHSSPLDRAKSNIVCDQTAVLTIFYSSKDYPATLRRVVIKDEKGKRITFLTNNFYLKPKLIANLYRQRWQVELFFKWIKQRLRTRRFMIPTRARSRRSLDCSLHLLVDRHRQETLAFAKQPS